jgi:hypothetical protein
MDVQSLHAALRRFLLLLGQLGEEDTLRGQAKVRVPHKCRQTPSLTYPHYPPTDRSKADANPTFQQNARLWALGMIQH